jgi:hypothetical protein
MEEEHKEGIPDEEGIPDLDAATLKLYMDAGMSIKELTEAEVFVALTELL